MPRKERQRKKKEMVHRVNSGDLVGSIDRETPMQTPKTTRILIKGTSKRKPPNFWEGPIGSGSRVGFEIQDLGPRAPEEIGAQECLLSVAGVVYAS